MAFLRVDGLAIEVLVDGITDDDGTIESYVRGAGAQDDLIGTTYSSKRSYTFETPPLPLADAVALAGWVRGRGHHWSFQTPDGATTRFSLVSEEAGLALTVGSSTSSALFGTWGMMLRSSRTSSVTASFGSEGDWSVVAYHRSTAGQPYLAHTVRSRDGVVDYWLSGATVPGPYISTDPLSVTASSGRLGVLLSGRTSLGTSATSQFGALKIFPFALTDEMILSLATPFHGNPTTGFARKPYVAVTGDMLTEGGPAVNGAGERGGRAFKGSTSGTAIQPVVTADGFKYNARAVTIQLVQR